MIEGVFALLFALGVITLPSDDPALIVLSPDPDGNVGQVIIMTDAGTTALTSAGDAALIADNQTAAERVILADEHIAEAFGDVINAEPMPPRSFLLYLEEAENRLTSESEKVINQVLKDIIRRDVVQISVIGHTDTTGSAERNAELGLLRAEQVRTILLNGGVMEHTVTARSHGEGDLLVETRDNVSEPRNRRVEVHVR